ncbi:unnamed protein product [Heligmosomoides polygyrus]|uniref:Wax ester/triacylglycerol synthase family O-acyltransferase n=1 Tax=Heligmosomoides polygyrus TaxID=6339 RepID=A0A183G713_HELPZ|nr:unnamed protein product [Heligmosomoides polygyrus]
MQEFQAIPAMRNMPRVDMGVQLGAETVVNPNLNSAIEQFTAPLVRFATGGQPGASDIEQLIRWIPNFIVNVPGLGNVDISKLDPNLVAHVLRGDQIPGIPKETLDGIVQQHMLKMHEAAAAAQRGRMVVVLVVLLGMCHGLIVLPVVFAALPFKETCVSQEKPHLLTIMDKKTRVGHQASHA